MRVFVQEWFVSMRMCMGFGDGSDMLVPMMHVVNVGMIVIDDLVVVAVGVALPEKRCSTGDHQYGGRSNG